MVMVEKFRRAIERILSWQVKRLIKRHNPKIVAITGSVGKTSTKAAIAHVLSSEYSVHAQAGSYNTLVGLPLAIFGESSPRFLINPLAWLLIFIRNEHKIWSPVKHDAWILEMGAERKGEIKQLLSFIKPDIGVVTAVKNVHTAEGQFKSIEEILDEKWQVAVKSRQGLVNADDSRLKSKLTELKNGKSYGVDHGNYHWTDLKLTDEGYKGSLLINNHGIKVQTKLIARHSLYSATAAVAVADLLAVDPDNIKKSLETLEPVNGRMNPLPGRHKTLVIDDSYNSSPDAAIAALEALFALPNTGRKIAILGSMNELGEQTEAGHHAVGQATKDLDLLVTIGDNARQFLVDAALKAGLKPDKIRSFNDPYRAGEFVLANLKKGDQILVKGSQNGVFAEEATKLLLAHRDDRNKLVRQSAFWLAKKKKAFGLK